MGFAFEIDVSTTPFNRAEVEMPAPFGARGLLAGQIGETVLLFTYIGEVAEILGSAKFLRVAANFFQPDEEIITVGDVRWLADPKRYPVRQQKNKPWAKIPSADFKLLLTQCNPHNTWGSAAPHVPREQDDLSASLFAEIMRRAGGQCQLTGFRGDTKEPVVPRIIRPLSEGGAHEPGNFVVLRRTWHSPFSSFHVSVGTGRVLVATPGRLGADLITRLNANGYLSVPDEVHRATLEANLSWHFEQYIRQLRWPTAPKL